jgi:hypothetical protein
MIATLSASSMTTDAAALHELVSSEESARREQWNAIVLVRTRWEGEAVRGLLKLTSLPTDWDGDGSPPPDARVVEAAIRFLAVVPELGLGHLPQPHVVPLSGGGVHFEWAVGARQLQVAIFPDAPADFLRVQGRAVLDQGLLSLTAWEQIRALFAWLTPAAA